MVLYQLSLEAIKINSTYNVDKRYSCMVSFVMRDSNMVSNVVYNEFNEIINVQGESYFHVDISYIFNIYSADF